MKLHKTKKWPSEPEALEKAIAEREQKVEPLKPGTKARIIWNDENEKKKTPYSIVYLHGFNASQGEGDPVHKTVAKKFGCNLYLSRLYGHGLKRKKNFVDISPKKLIQSAEDACCIGQQIGKKVILMGTSTGGALAIHLAASTEFSSSIAALVLYSPLVHLYGVQSLLLENAVGRTLLQAFPGRNFTLRSADVPSGPESNIWYGKYLLNGALTLGKTIQKIMQPSVFQQVRCPAFVGYYYGDAHNHDHTVSISSIKRMARKLGTPAEKVQVVNFPNAGTHVICSSLLSAANNEVIASTEHFFEGTLALKNVPDTA